MTLEQVYAAIGGDYKGVMERLPSADFVRRFALKFLQDDSFPNLKKALEEKDAPTAFRAAHTLKGVCQNLGFDALYVPSSALTEALRGGSLDGADELFPPVEKEYQRVVEALKSIRITKKIPRSVTKLRGIFLLNESQEISVIISGLPAEPRSS